MTETKNPFGLPKAASAAPKIERRSHYWWNQPLPADLSDEEFAQAAYFHHYLASTDHDLAFHRNRAKPLLKQLFERQVQSELEAYRKERDGVSPFKIETDATTV